MAKSPPDCVVCKATNRTRGLHCIRCGQHVYLVRAANGEEFLVDTVSGSRWCPG